MFNQSSLTLADAAASPAAWGLMLFCIMLGVLVALTPNKRTTEIKRPKDE